MKDKSEKTNIEKEISTLAARREALAIDATTAQGELERQRKSLVAGKAGVAEVTTAQLTHTTLTEAVRDIDSQLAALRQELAEAQTAELREAKMRAMVDLAAAGTKAFANYQAVRAEADAALLAIAERLEAGQAAIQQKRERFLELFSTFCPHAAMQAGWVNPNSERMRAEDADAARLLDELRRERGADTAAVQSAMFGPTSQIDSMDLQQRTVADKPLAFAGLFRQLIDTAEGHARQQAIAAADAARARSSASEATPAPVQAKPFELEWELIEPGQSGGLYRRRTPLEKREVWVTTTQNESGSQQRKILVAGEAT